MYRRIAAANFRSRSVVNVAVGLRSSAAGSKTGATDIAPRLHYRPFQPALPVVPEIIHAKISKMAAAGIPDPGDRDDHPRPADIGGQFHSLRERVRRKARGAPLRNPQQSSAGREELVHHGRRHHQHPRRLGIPGAGHHQAHRMAAGRRISSSIPYAFSLPCSPCSSTCAGGCRIPIA